mgnify:CR=1 FL=1|jgi:hypothetical protein
MSEVISNFFTKARIRQIIALSLTALVVYEAAWADEVDATTLVGIYGAVLGFYFSEGD